MKRLKAHEMSEDEIELAIQREWKRIIFWGFMIFVINLVLSFSSFNVFGAVIGEPPADQRPSCDNALGGDDQFPMASVVGSSATGSASRSAAPAGVAAPVSVKPSASIAEIIRVFYNRVLGDEFAFGGEVEFTVAESDKNVATESKVRALKVHRGQGAKFEEWTFVSTEGDLPLNRFAREIYNNHGTLIVVLPPNLGLRPTEFNTRGNLVLAGLDAIQRVYLTDSTRNDVRKLLKHYGISELNIILKNRKADASNDFLLHPDMAIPEALRYVSVMGNNEMENARAPFRTNSFSPALRETKIGEVALQILKTRPRGSVGTNLVVRHADGQWTESRYGVYPNEVVGPRGMTTAFFDVPDFKKDADESEAQSDAFFLIGGQPHILTDYVSPRLDIMIDYLATERELTLPYRSFSYVWVNESQQFGPIYYIRTFTRGPEGKFVETTTDADRLRELNPAKGVLESNAPNPKKLN